MSLDPLVTSPPGIVLASKKWLIYFFNSQASAGVNYQERTANIITPAIIIEASGVIVSDNQYYK
jgi:hypothetical protein